GETAALVVFLFVPIMLQRVWSLMALSGHSRHRNSLSVIGVTDGVIGRPACRSLEIVGAALQADGETRSAFAASSIRRRSVSHGPFCRTRRISQGNKYLHRGRHGQDRAGSEGGKRAGSSSAGADEPRLSLQTDWIGSGPLSQWLYSALAEAGLPVICVETRHMRAVLKAQINKTDRNDARGIAQMMRVGLYRPVHVKTLRSQKLRMLLTHRKLLQSKALAIDNDLRGTLRNFGLKVGMVGKVKFEARIKELVENIPDLAV